MPLRLLNSICDVKSLIPKRTRERVFIYGRDYRPHILNQISTRTLSTLLSFQAKLNGEEGNNMHGKGVAVKAGTVKEVMLEADFKRISCVKWKFTAETKDIVFSVMFYCNSSNKKGESGTIEMPLLRKQGNSG